jgi:hypothetical protein
VMARKYNCLMDSIPFGTIYLTPDRRLVAQMIEPSGQYIELQIPVEQPPATE